MTFTDLERCFRALDLYLQTDLIMNFDQFSGDFYVAVLETSQKINVHMCARILEEVDTQTE